MRHVDLAVLRFERKTLAATNGSPGMDRLRETGAARTAIRKSKPLMLLQLNVRPTPPGRREDELSNPISDVNTYTANHVAGLR